LDGEEGVEDDTCFGDFIRFVFLTLLVVDLAIVALGLLNSSLPRGIDFFGDFSVDFDVTLFPLELPFEALDDTLSDGFFFFSAEERFLFEVDICEDFLGFIVLFRFAGPLVSTLVFFLPRIILVLAPAGFLPAFGGIFTPFFLVTTMFNKITFTNLHKN
jgi:hypothetical protein